MQKVSTAKKTEQVLNEEIESSIKEALKEAHFKESAAGSKFAADSTANRMKRIGLDETKDMLKKERVKDFNLIGYEAEAWEAFLRNLEREMIRAIREDALLGGLSNKAKESVEHHKYIAETNFHSWYTGNYDKKTGRITLYRYVNDFPDFDKVVKGKEGLIPRGLTGRSEEQLLESLRNPSDTKDGFGNYQKQMRRIFADYLAGKDVSLHIFKIEAFRNFDLDPCLCWTSLDKPPITYFNPMRYRIRIEIKPNEAFRSGGLDEKGDWTGDINREWEWRTIGKVPKEAITEIVDLESGKVVYSKKK
ncbi:hypothetical protein H0N98_00115 [Candidatus Micrarchaeota archaeon]|nr:hypothetical protein [Candidatus Micrarchaeota archaeon]